MLKVNCTRWSHSKELLREEALKAEHIRTRERLMALYEISEGKSATLVAKETKRHPETVISWGITIIKKVWGHCNISEQEGENLFCRP